jgi:para-nitrobenzyl esterase
MKKNIFRTGIRIVMIMFLCVPILSAAEAVPYTKGMTQQTLYGTVQGSVSTDGLALIWKGIPYAASPEGDLRWKAPAAPEKWTGILDAVKSGNVAVQFNGGKTTGSENCLNLDIFRPDTEEQNLPVMVYIHGGNNQTGAGSEINPQLFVVQANVIVVSVNYRLGLFGFNNLPALKTGNPEEDSGNYALLDMAAALDWIKNSITAFGGNADNVTVSGFSAGGRDVMAMLISPLFKGKFKKAISFSGGMTIADSAKSEELIARAIAPLAVTDGVCKTEKEAATWLMSASADVRKYLYSLPSDRLAPLMGNAGIRMAVFPHLYNDGTVLPKDGFRTKKYNSVPLIMVTGSGEFSLFCRFDNRFAAIKDETLLSENKEAADYSFACKYGSELYELFNTQESAERMFNSYKAPVYTCDFIWGTNTQITGERMGKLFGPFHGFWIPFLMGNTSGASAMFPEAFKGQGASDLTRQFTGYISNFLWSGNPNGKNLTTWERWSVSDTKPVQLMLDADNTKALVTMAKKRSSYEQILKNMQEDTSVTQADKNELIRTVLNGRWFSGRLDRYFKTAGGWIQTED